MNKVWITGNLGADPELRYTQSGTAVVNLNLAVRRDFKNQQGERETDWVSVVAWKGLAETMANHLKKGSKIGVTGRIQVRSYDDKEGNKRKAFEIVADGMEFLDTKRNSDSGGNGSTVNMSSIGQDVAFDNDDMPF